LKIGIFHTDLDGISNLLLVKQFNLQFDEIYSLNYNEYDEYDSVINLLTEEDTIIFSDFSPNKKWMEMIEEKNCSIEVYDHHGDKETKDSAYDLLSNWKYPKLKYFYEEDKCGSEIFYLNYIKPTLKEVNPVVEEYLKLVSIFDTGQTKHVLYNKAQDLNRLFWKTINYGKKDLERYNFFIINCMKYKFDNNDIFKFNKLEETKIKEDKNRELEIFNKIISGGKSTIKTRKDDKGRYFSVIKLKSKATGISNLLLDKFKKLSYILIINYYDSDNMKISLRSRDEIDVTELENVKGHKCAAGYEDVTNQICEDIWNGKIYSLKYKKE